MTYAELKTARRCVTCERGLRNNSADVRCRRCRVRHQTWMREQRLSKRPYGTRQPVTIRTVQAPERCARCSGLLVIETRDQAHCLSCGNQVFACRDARQPLQEAGLLAAASNPEADQYLWRW